MSKSSPIPRSQVFFLALLLCLISSANPADAQTTLQASLPPARRASQQDASNQPISVPANTSWTRDLIIAIMWLFIAAILLGPIVIFFETKVPLDTPR